jgi:GNAT superfamily N-acetyltransferase
MAINISSMEKSAKGIKLSAQDKGKEVGRTYIYFLQNDLHVESFGFIEDVFVEKEYRGRGLGAELVKKAMDLAKKEGCYKVILTSRYSKPDIHRLYEKAGFVDHGKEFRIDL